jgi:hypothetical protein
MSAPSSLAGVSRFVIIGGQIHSYVDIMLDTTELCGDNGKGKTSTMNVLQFLYIANERQWSLGKHSLADSKDFYFPPANASFAATVFEVRTPTGLRLVVVRRPNGLLADLRYYVAEGAYDRTDFVNERQQPRKWDEVVLRLGARGPVRDISDYHQLCLTGRADESSGLPNLGLVPLSINEGSSYEKFAASFINLLRLKDMDQSYLQEILVSYAGLTKHQQVVDLEASLAAEINSIRAGVAKAERLGNFAASIRQAETAFEDMLATGLWLNQAHAKVLALKREYDVEYPSRYKAAKAAVDAAESELRDIKSERRTLDGQKNSSVIAESDLARNLLSLHEAEQQFQDFDRAGESAAQAAALAEAKAIRGRVARATDKSLLELETDVAELTSAVRRLDGDIAAHRDLLISWLRNKLPDADVARLHAVFSPEVFRTRIGEGGATILSEAQLEAELNAVLALIRGTTLSTDGLRLPLDTKKSAESVKELADVKKLRARLEDETARLGKAQKLLEDAKVHADLEARAATLEVNAATLGKRIEAYDAMKAGLLQRGAWEIARAGAKQDIARIDAMVEVLDQRAENSGVRKALAQDGMKNLELEKAQIGVLTMDGSLRAVDTVVDQPRNPRPVEESGLLRLMQAYKKQLGEYGRNKGAWESERANIESNLSDLYPGITAPREMLKHLAGEVAGLEARRHFENGRLRTALASATGLFQELVSGITKLEREVRKIQRAFAKVKISGIEWVRCDVERKKVECGRLQALVNLNTDLNLFDDKTTVNEQFERIQSSRVYKISDYFSVTLQVKAVGQPPHSYSEFSSGAGSTGQVIMLKTLFNLLVIKSYLRDDQAAIPYFLDEVNNLDTGNFSGIVEFSRQLGFEGIYAAPLPSPAIRRFYTINYNGDRIVVRDEHSQVLTPRRP